MKTQPKIRNLSGLLCCIDFRYIKNNKFIYLLMMPSLVITFIFAYLPMPGILISFQDYDMFKGILRSQWVGMRHIMDIIRIPEIYISVINTLTLSVLTMIVTFPAPLVLAILFNELRAGLFKRVVQTVSYLPYFLSWISIVGIVTVFLSVHGTINDLRVTIFGPGTERIMFLSKQQLFVPILILLTLWKNVGWNSIIYIAAISSIDITLYEAAKIDGSTRMQQIRYITLPCLMNTAIILLIFNIGGLFSSNFELVYGLQNPYIDFDVISTVVFSRGIQLGNYSMATAVGFLQGLIAFILVFISNKIAKYVSDVYIW